MKNLTGILVFCFCSFSVCESFSQILNTDVDAKLKIETSNNIVKVIAVSSNTTEVYFNLRYVVSIIRPIPDSKETNNYSLEERFTLEPIETKNLTETAFTIDEDEYVILLLLIYDEDDKLVAKDRVVFNDKEEVKKEEVELPIDGIELTGIVADETKTKIGKDFYDYFYMYYTYSNIKGHKVVTIEEIVSFRRNTFLKVKVDDDVILEFYSTPSDEYIESMSKTAIQGVYRYFENLKKENAYITQY